MCSGNIVASGESEAIAGVSVGKGNGIAGGLGMIIGCGGIIYGWRQKRLYSMKINVSQLK